MKKIILCFAVSILLAATGWAELSRVSVEGNHFVTAGGKTIVFRGLDASDPDKLQRNGQWNKHYFEEAKSWGANIVRLPVHPAAWHTLGKTNYLKLLDEGVEWAREENLYVIIDWHSIGNLHQEKFFSNPSDLFSRPMYDTTKNETFDFWRTMAKHYRGNNTVAFFELFNEPAVGDHLHLGNCTWPQWKSLLEKMIEMIRANGGTAVPLVSGFDFAYDLTPVAANPVDAKNIGYTAHPYPMKARQPWDKNWTRDWGFVAEKYPMILTEIGFSEPKGSSVSNPVTGDENYGDAITSYCATNGISYTVWCFDPNWGPTLIKDWNFTPTRAGAFFKKAMQEKPPSQP